MLIICILLSQTLVQRKSSYDIVSGINIPYVYTILTATFKTFHWLNIILAATTCEITNKYV